MAEKKEEPKLAEIVDVTTQTAPMIKLPDGTIINELELLLRIYNDLQALKRALL